MNYAVFWGSFRAPAESQINVVSEHEQIFNRSIATVFYTIIIGPKIKTIDQWFSRDNIIIIFFYWQRLLLLLPELYSPKWNGIRRRRRPCDGRVTMHTNHRSVWVHLHLSYPSVSFWMNNHPAQTNKQQQIINKKLKTQNGIICAQEKNKKRKLLILLEVFFLSLFFFWTHRITFFSTLQTHW